MIVLAYLAWHPLQQAEDKILRSKRPVPANLFSARIVRFEAALLHSPSKFQPGAPTLLRQAVFSKQAVTTQPGLPFLFPSQITRITAPAVPLQSLPFSQ